jgi:hypothetical protein
MIFSSTSQSEQENGDTYFASLATNQAYPYALASALAKHANDILASRKGEEQEKKQEPKNEKLAEVLAKWKEDNAENADFFKTTLVISPATRYYSGKQGTQILKESGLENVDNEMLSLIVKSCLLIKQEVSATVKENENNPWVSTRTEYTPAGWKSYETVKYTELYNQKVLTDEQYADKMSWINTFDFAPGWQYANKNKSQEIDLRDRMLVTDTVADILQEYNNCFVLNAINKDQLWFPAND